MQISTSLINNQRHLPLPWRYPVDDFLPAYPNSDLRFSIDGSDTIRGAGERMYLVLKQILFPEIDEFDLIMAGELNAPLPVESFENEDRYDPGEVLRQRRYYRTPNYLVSIDDQDYYMLATNLLNCLCIRFYSEAEDFRYLDPIEGLKPPYAELGRAVEQNNADVVIVSHNSNFREISTFLKERFPHIPLIIYCEGKERRRDPGKYDQMACDLRRQGYFAFSAYEVLDKQEYISRLVAHALGKEGIRRLRRSFLPVLG